MSVMSQTYSIIIDWGISAPGHGKEVVDGLNAVDKSYIYQLMSKVQLPGSTRRFMSIEGIALEHFSAAPQSDINSSSLPCPRHAVFHSFYLIIANRMHPLPLHTEND